MRLHRRVGDEGILITRLDMFGRARERGDRIAIAPQLLALLRGEEGFRLLLISLRTVSLRLVQIPLNIEPLAGLIGKPSGLGMGIGGLNSAMIAWMAADGLTMKAGSPQEWAAL